MARHVIFLMMFFTIPGMASAQQKKMVIAGRVVDLYNTPLNNSYVTNVLSGETVYVHRSGIFYFSCPRKNMNLRVTCPGYDTLRRSITALEMEMAKHDTLYMSLVLNERPQVLDTIVITPQWILTAYDPDKTDVIDFDFFENKLVALVKADGKDKLRMVDEKNGNMIRELQLWFDPEAFLHDCYGHLLIKSAGHFYTVYTEENEFHLSSPFSIEQYNYYLYPCLCATKENLYLQEFGVSGQSAVFFYLNKKSKDRVLLRTITDKESEDFDRHLRNQIAVMKSYGLEEKDDALSRDIEVIKITEQTEWVYSSVLTKPIYLPLLEVDSNLVLFDHLNDSAIVYNRNGKVKTGFCINYHLQTNWAKEVLTDREKKHVYVRTTNDKVSCLVEIDPLTGKNLNTFKLELYIAPEQLKIMNNMAYFLYRDPETQETRICKQALRVK